MNDTINLHIIGGISIERLPDIIKSGVKEYFSDQYADLNYRLNNNQDVTLSEMFHILIGVRIFGINLVKEPIKHFIDSCKFGRGYIPTNKNHSLYEILEKGGMKEDIYSTYYALMCLKLLDEGVELKLNIGEYEQSSKLIYSYDVSGTIEERRLHSEIFISNLLAIKLLSSFGMTKSLNLSENIKKVTESIQNHKYLSLILYSCEMASILKYELPDEILEHIYNFVKSHFEQGSGGFYEYFFEDVKRDENRGRLQRFKHDILVPSVSATYAAIQIAKLTNIAGLQSLIQQNKEKIKEFLLNSQCSESKGFGTEIHIAKMPGLFGKKATPWETLMAIKGLELLTFFKN